MVRSSPSPKYDARALGQPLRRADRAAFVPEQHADRNGDEDEAYKDTDHRLPEAANQKVLVTSVT